MARAAARRSTQVDGEGKRKTPRWFAVYTRCHHENRVVSYLQHNRFSTLLPKRQVYSRRRDRRTIIELPVFPGYAFVESEPRPQAFTEILKAPGVVYIVGRPRPVPIAEHEIETLRIMLNAECDMSPCAYFSTGERVRVASGPLIGAVGYVAEIVSAKRMLVVSVDILGQSVATRLYDYEVEKI